MTRELTIGLPVYNGERFLEAALASILGQTFGDFTLVVSDNASTDATPDILETYAARDGRVVLLRSETNRGAAWNYNRVFADCATPFFKWAAADDMLAPTCVERCLGALREAPPSVVLAFPRTRLVDEDGTDLGELADPLATSPADPPHKRLRQVVMNVVWGNVVFGVTRTDALRRTRLHGSYPSSDYVLLAELALVGAFVEVPEPLFLRRDHPGMSRRANPSVSELARWFAPDRRPVRHEQAHVFWQHLVAIVRADLSPLERALALATFLVSWTRRKAKLRTRARRLLARTGR